MASSYLWSMNGGYKRWVLVVLFTPFLQGCLSDYLPESPKQQQERLLQEAIAAGSGCRQVGRSIENCFERYEKLPRTGILNGWREMDDYMRTNKMDSQNKEPVAVYGSERPADGVKVEQESGTPKAPSAEGVNSNAANNSTNVPASGSSPTSNSGTQMPAVVPGTSAATSKP